MEEAAQDRVVKKRAPKILSYTHVEAHQFQQILKDRSPEGRLMNLMDNKGWDGLTVYDRQRDTFTTALYLAAEAEKDEDTPVLKWLLSWSATKVDDILEADSSNGRTALHAAATNDSNALSVLWVLMDELKTTDQFKQAVNIPDKEGNTPLHIAVEKKNLRAMAILLFWADPCRHNTKGDTPLHLAVRGGELDILKGLTPDLEKVQTPLTVDIPDLEKGQTPLTVDIPDLEKGQTPLHLAAEADREDMVALLIDKGADPCRKDKKGTSPLYLAALKENESVFQWLLQTALKTRFQEAHSVEDMDNALEELRSHTIDKLNLALKCDWNIHNVYDDKTALYLASESGNVSLVQVLLTINDVVKENGQGDTALHAAASGGVLEIVKVLLTAGAEINKQNKLGQTALHFAIGQGKVDIADTLLKSGADIHIQDNTGAGVLHFAARGGAKGILEWLSEYFRDRMDVNQATEAGLTPLHFAAWNGNKEALEWLLKIGDIKLDAVDNVENGMPWQWAAMGGNSGCLDSLISEHVRRRIQVLPGSHKNWKRAFQRIEEHEQAKQLDYVAWAFLFELKDGLKDELKDDHSVLEPGILSCAAAYGDDYTNKYLARVLSVGKSNQPSMEKGRAWIENLVKESRLLEWAACTPFIRDPELEFDGSFNAVKLVVEFLMMYRDVKAINNQLKLAFKSFFKEMETVASCMAECCARALPDMIKEAVWEELKDINFDLNYQKLSNKYKVAIDGVRELVEDVPVAYWVARLEEDRSKDLKNMSHKKEGGRPHDEGVLGLNKGPDEGEQRKLIAQRVEDLSKKFIKDYPNDKGPRTGRTALHWATIFGEREIVIALSAKGCKPEIGDDCGKLPYWDEQEEDTVLLNSLKWSGYTDSLHRDRQMFVDALNAILVGSALIAGVTFGGFLNPPLGYNMKFKNSEYAYIDKTGVVVFWVANSLSFFFAMASALAGVTGVLPSPDKFNLKVIRRLRTILIVAAFMLVLSIVFVLVAFGAAGFSALPPLRMYQRNMIVTLVPGALVCVAPLCAFIYAIYKLNSRNLRFYSKQFIKVQGKCSGSETLEELVCLKDLLSPQSPLLSPQHPKRYARTGQLPWEDGLESLIHIDGTHTTITIVDGDGRGAPQVRE